MFSQLLSQPPIPLNQAKPGLKFAGPIEAVIMKGLSKDPKQRYASVVDFANALKEVLLAAGNGTTEGGLFSRVKSIFRK
jgi:serine/threonine-protein kinase